MNGQACTVFEEKGGKAVDVLYHADSEDFNLPFSSEVYENVDEKGLVPPRMLEDEFESIVNFLSRADILPTWNGSAPFRIMMDKVDEQDIVMAYEYVSEEPYQFPETSEPVGDDSIVPDYLRS